MRVIADVVKEHDLFLVADEVYREFIYDDEPMGTFCEMEDIKDHVIVVDSISKRFSACGARIGSIISRNREFMDEAMKLANKIAKNAPIAVRNCKKAINDGISLPIEKAVEVEEKLFGDCFETHEQQEGMACFLSREKPKPKAVFTNN